MMLRTLAALGLVLAASFGCAGGGSEDKTYDTAAILHRAGPAPWRGSGVLRARWSGNRAVEWLDRRTGATRRIQPGGNQRSIFVQDGHRILTWTENLDPVWKPQLGTASLADVVDPHDPALEHAAEILSYWRMLKRGKARIVDEGELDGRPVWIVELDGVRAELDRVTFLPLRVFGESPEEGVPASTRTVAYTEVPRADRPELFSFERGSRYLELRLRYRDLAFVPFPIYAPGPRLGDLTYSSASSYTQTRLGHSTLFLSYLRGAGPSAEAAITLSESRGPDVRGFPGGGATIGIAGAPRRVRLTNDGQIWVAIGKTLIHGRTALPRTETIRFLRALRPR